MILGTKAAPIRCTFNKVFEPASIEGSAPRYSTQIMIPKTDTQAINMVKAAIAEATDKGASKGCYSKAATKLPTFRSPLRDGDLEAEANDKKAYLRGHYFFNASCSETQPPAIVDRFAQPITNQNDFYDGCYCIFDINFYPFKFGTGGVACGLNAIMKREDGQRLDGRLTAAQAFASVTDDAADELTETLV